MSVPTRLAILKLSLAAAAVSVACGAAFANAVVFAKIDGHVQTASSVQLANAADLSDRWPDERIAFVDTAEGDAPATTVSFSLKTSSPVAIEVLDLEGRRVRLLASGLWARGEHRLAWHGEDEAGQLVAPGVYVVALRTDDRDVARFAR